MSYDMRVCVKVEGCGKYAVVGVSEYNDPTYNLREMSLPAWIGITGKVSITRRTSRSQG